MPPRVTASRLQTAPARSPASRAALQPPYVVGFYLVPQFPMMAFAAAIEPLRSPNRPRAGASGPRRAANRLRAGGLFEGRLYSRDGEPVRASNGCDIAVHGAIEE